MPEPSARARAIAPSDAPTATNMPIPSYFGFKDEGEWNRAVEQAEHFRTSCEKIANDETERARLLEEGYRDEPAQAVEFMLERDRKIGNETAEGNYRDRLMSEKALAEKAQVEADTFGHVPEIPEKPIKKRGRPPKAVTA